MASGNRENVYKFILCDCQPRPQGLLGSFQNGVEKYPEGPGEKVEKFPGELKFITTSDRQETQ